MIWPCAKDFKKVPEAAWRLQGSEVTTHTVLLCSLVGEKEASIKRGGMLEFVSLHTWEPWCLWRGVQPLESSLACNKPVRFPKHLCHLVHAGWIILF